MTLLKTSGSKSILLVWGAFFSVSEVYWHHVATHAVYVQIIVKNGMTP
jgi:hypothetical protein